MAVPQRLQLRFGPALRGKRVFALHRIGDCLDMQCGMRPINDLRHGREIQTGHTLDPRRPIIGGGHLHTAIQPPPQPFRLLIRGEGVGIPWPHLMTMLPQRHERISVASAGTSRFTGPLVGLLHADFGNGHDFHFFPDLRPNQHHRTIR